MTHVILVRHSLQDFFGALSQCKSVSQGWLRPVGFRLNVSIRLAWLQGRGGWCALLRASNMKCSVLANSKQNPKSTCDLHCRTSGVGYIHGFLVIFQARPRRRPAFLHVRFRVSGDMAGPIVQLFPATSLQTAQMSSNIITATETLIVTKTASSNYWQKIGFKF